MQTRVCVMRVILTVLILAVAVLGALPAAAQLEEDASAYDESGESLAFYLTKEDIESWRESESGMRTVVAMVLTPAKGDELYALTRLHVGETMTLYMGTKKLKDVTIGDPIANSELVVELLAPERDVLVGQLPRDKGKGVPVRVIVGSRAG